MTGALSQQSMIAITFSLPDESRDFLRMVQVTERVGSGVGSMIRGTLGEVPVVVWHIGVGRDRAAREAARLLEDVKPALVICAGYGGALVPTMRLGEIVLDARGSNLARSFNARPGNIFSAANVAESVEEKRSLGQQTGALAVDMETAVVAEIFEHAGIPVIGIRAISDRMEDAVPVPMEYWFDLDRQRPRVLALLGFLARHPMRIAPFARFVRGLAPARASLAKTLTAMVSDLGGKSQAVPNEARIPPR
jgi:adenosylhomocysteine nucleosidase